MVSKFLAFVGAAVVVSTMPAQAENSAQAPKKSLDPNEVVCEKSEVLGSRVAVKKVCMTRLEWAERRQQDKDEIDRAQKTRGMRGE